LRHSGLIGEPAIRIDCWQVTENPVFSRVGRKLASGEAHSRMNTGIERAANVIGSIGILACLVLQALQSFVFAPLAGATGSNFLAVLGLFVFVATMATLSFLSGGGWQRLAPSSMPRPSPGYGGASSASAHS
jgi:hypothetical protein